MTETWKPVPYPPFNEYYEAADDGQLRVLKGRQGTQKGKLLKPTARKDGWFQWTLKAPGGHVMTILAQRLIAEIFVPNPTGLGDVAFIDGDKTNRRADNLRWTDRAESMKEAGVKRRDEGNHNTILSADRVREFRIRAQTESIASLAREFGISRSHGSNIVHGKARGHVE